MRDHLARKCCKLRRGGFGDRNSHVGMHLTIRHYEALLVRLASLSAEVMVLPTSIMVNTFSSESVPGRGSALKLGLRFNRLLVDSCDERCEKKREFE